MKTGKLDIKGDTLGIFESTDIKSLSLNIMLDAFRIAQQASLTLFQMVRGFGDDFVDQSGIDLVNSVNQSYNGVGYYYQPTSLTGGIDLYVKLMLHLDNDVVDASLSPKTVTNNGVTFSNANAKFGYCGIFDGNSYLSIPDSTDFNFTGDFTWDFWVNPTNLTQAPVWIGQHLNVAHNVYLYMYGDGNLYFAAGEGIAMQFRFAPGFSYGSWNHLAIVRNGNNWYAFVNGVSKSLTLLSGSYSCTMPTNNGTFMIGGLGASSSMIGSLDEIRISNGIARWIAPFSVPLTEYSPASGTENMTLISLVQTQITNPTSTRMVLFEEDVDAITLNTDLKAYLSRDNGNTFTQVTLEEEGNYITSSRILSGLVNLSAQPSGNQLIYKIETANNKNLKLHGIGISYK